MTRNQILIHRTFRAPPHIWVQIEAIQDELLQQLRAVDAEVEALIARRLQIVTELRRCRNAFGHVGHWNRRQVPMPGDIDAVPEGTRPIARPELRELVRRLLQESNRPLHLSELHRMLLAHGLHPEGHPTKAISDALRAEVAAGRVVRMGRGLYWHAQGRSTA